MAYPQVKFFCCGVSLIKGSLIIAWLQIIIGILYIVLGGTYVIVFKTNSGQSDVSHFEPTLIRSIISGVIYLILGTLLLLGITRGDTRYISIWVIVSTVFTGVVLILAFIIGLIAIIQGAIAVGMVSIGLQIMVSTIDIYFITVVSSCRKELTEKAREV